MSLPLSPPYPPMEARLVAAIPEGPGWQYEPKWDGFRCLAFRDGGEVFLQSKAGQPLGRYFPEIVEAVRALPAPRFVLDGELVVPAGPAGALSFDQLLLRVHPSSKRVARLAAETPALLIVFDLLVDDEGRPLTDEPLAVRRARLEELAARCFPQGGRLRLSPATTDLGMARAWLGGAGGALDGVVAKLYDLPYLAGERDAIEKVKRVRTADCVVGGFRYAEGKPFVGSLLLGLYDGQGLLHHVGFTSGLSMPQREELTPRLEALVSPPGFTGRAPGGPSRWSTRRSAEWQPLRPELVVEVCYDHFTAGRFRHGTRLLRFRPDKAPRACTLAQVEQESRVSAELVGAGPARLSPGGPEEGGSRKAEPLR